MTCRRSRARAAAPGALLAAATIAAAACSPREVPLPDRVAQVARAESAATPATFDTVHWASDSTRMRVGNAAYAAACTKCHGPLGRGGTAYAREHGLRVPSLVRGDWPYDDVPEIRRRIFAGHASGMPSWGLRGEAGLTPREVDAVAFYVLHQLREDADGGEEAGR